MLANLLKQLAEEQKYLDEEPEAPATETEILELKRRTNDDKTSGTNFITPKPCGSRGLKQ